MVSRGADLLAEPRFRLKVRGREVDCARPLVMGVLNLTPDSFYDGGRLPDPVRTAEQAARMLEEGAGILDFGAESTRPGSDPVSEEEELRRLEAAFAVAASWQDRDVLLSIDTTKPKVAREALAAGFHIVNNVSGRLDAFPLAEAAAEFGAAYVVMHSLGTPKTMQVDPAYADVVGDVEAHFVRALEAVGEMGTGSVILDPGIGFGKTLSHNLALIAATSRFKKLGRPVLIGASRKSMIGQMLGGAPPERRLAGTLAVHYEALRRGADILRVHDVAEAVDSVRIAMAFETAGPSGFPSGEGGRQDPP
jgi:dihydropteroate synthase